MENIFHFKSQRNQYVADVAVICCFDERIRLATNKFLENRGIVHPDMIVVAGGAKTLASPTCDSEREFILQQVDISARLHGTRCVYLMNHSDCGAYGGLAAFQGDPLQEAEQHQRELTRAAEAVRAKFPKLEVQCFFVTFDGVHQLRRIDGMTEL